MLQKTTSKNLIQKAQEIKIDEQFLEIILGDLIKQKKKSDFLTDALRSIGEEPVFYQLENAYLYIEVFERGTGKIAWVLFRKWGEIDGFSNKAEQVFEELREAQKTKDIIVRSKLKKGYKPIF